MKYNFDELIDRSGTHSLKYEACRKINPFLPEGSIPLWVADMDFACAPQFSPPCSAGENRILGYSVLGEDTQAAVSRWMDRRFGWAVAPEEIVLPAELLPLCMLPSST